MSLLYNWKIYFIPQFLQAHIKSKGTKADCLRRITDVIKRNALPCISAKVAQVLQGVVFTIVARYHFYTGGAAILTFQLVVEREIRKEFSHNSL